LRKTKSLQSDIPLFKEAYTRQKDQNKAELTLAPCLYTCKDCW